MPILQSGAGARAPAGTAGGAAAAAAPGDPAVGGLAPAPARGRAGEGAALLRRGGCSEPKLRQLQSQPHPLGPFFRHAAPASRSQSSLKIFLIGSFSDQWNTAY